MNRRARSRLFWAALGVLALVALVGLALLRGPLGDAALAAQIMVALGLALAAAAVLAALATAMLRRDVRDLVTSARARPRPPAETDDRPDVDDWVHDIAADAADHRTALARERALLSAVLEALNDGVIVLDADDRIVVMNEAARRLFDLPATPIGEPLIEVSRAPSLIELVRGPQARSAELQLRPELQVVARIAPALTTGLRVLLVEDVTAMRRLETIRRDFVANVSHELRTPVAIIRANAETLCGGAAADPAIADRLLDGVHRNAERLARMLADLLDLSRLDAGQFRFERTPVPVQTASEAARAAVEPLAAERGVAVDVDVAPALVARADARALDHALVNLVENAVKYGHKGGHVWIRGARVGDGVRLEVADDGPGIAPKHRARVFERFYRVDAGRARDAGGTGLGLAIVKHLVESMGGRVGVDANEPTGTRFWIELPAAEEAAAA